MFSPGQTYPAYVGIGDSGKLICKPLTMDQLLRPSRKPSTDRSVEGLGSPTPINDGLINPFDARWSFLTRGLFA